MSFSGAESIDGPQGLTGDVNGTREAVRASVLVDDEDRPLPDGEQVGEGEPDRTLADDEDVVGVAGGAALSSSAPSRWASRAELGSSTGDQRSDINVNQQNLR